MHKVGKDDRAMYQCVVTSRHHNMQAAAQLALGGGYGVGEVGAWWARRAQGGREGRFSYTASVVPSCTAIISATDTVSM